MCSVEPCSVLPRPLTGKENDTIVDQFIHLLLMSREITIAVDQLETLQIYLNTDLAFGPAHTLQHLLAKFGFIITPGAVPGVN